MTESFFVLQRRSDTGIPELDSTWYDVLTGNNITEMRRMKRNYQKRARIAVYRIVLRHQEVIEDDEAVVVSVGKDLLRHRGGVQEYRHEGE